MGLVAIQVTAPGLCLVCGKGDSRQTCGSEDPRPRYKGSSYFLDASFRFNLVRFRKDRLSFLMCSWSDSLQLALIPIHPLFERCLLSVINKNPKRQETLQKPWGFWRGNTLSTNTIVGFILTQ